MTDPTGPPPPSSLSASTGPWLATLDVLLLPLTITLSCSRIPPCVLDTGIAPGAPRCTPMPGRASCTFELERVRAPGRRGSGPARQPGHASPGGATGRHAVSPRCRRIPSKTPGPPTFG